jgi:hypothetical protein
MGFRRQHTQLIAAAKAGISERTGRRIERDPRLPSQKHAGRKRRRQVPDPLDGIWESDILPLLESRPGLRPIALLEEMQRRHPDRDWDRLRRTLERRVRAWHSLHGPEREVIFRQDHPPGRQGLSDFTDMGDLAVSIAGQARHRAGADPVRQPRLRQPRRVSELDRRAGRPAQCAAGQAGRAGARPSASPAAPPDHRL